MARNAERNDDISHRCGSCPSGSESRNLRFGLGYERKKSVKGDIRCFYLNNCKDGVAN